MIKHVLKWAARPTVVRLPGSTDLLIDGIKVGGCLAVAQRRRATQFAETYADDSATAEGVTLSSGRLHVTLDETTGAIASLTCRDIQVDFARGTSEMGLNEYRYVAGRDPSDPKPNGPVTITVKEAGPMVASLLVESDAPGCRRRACR